VKQLHLSKDFSLPREALLHVWSILAVRGAGKTYTASVLVEEILDHKMMPVIVIDPMDVWWGLKASADGKREGYPIIVMGGTHADVPLQPTGGALVADFFIEHRQSFILVPAHGRDRWARKEAVRFVADFGARLYQRNAGQLVFLVVDEADIFANQRPGDDELRCLGVMEDITKRGRTPGIFPLLITQRSSNLNKNVLDETEMLVALRTMSPRDQDALKSWFQHLPRAQQERKETLLDTWAKLPNGTAWFWCPPMDVFQQVHVRERQTFNSSATPKFGEKPKEPKVLAPVDLEILKERMAATIERAKQTDPKALQQEVVRLRAELARKPAAVTLPTLRERRVEVPVLKDGHLQRFERAVGVWVKGVGHLEGITTTVGGMVRELQVTLAKVRANGAVAPASPPARSPIHAAVPAPHPVLASRPAHPTGDVKLGLAQRKILTVLAQYPEGRTVTQLALLTGYAVGGGAFRNPMSALRTLQYIAGSGQIRLTPQGEAALGNWEPLPEPGSALLDYWMRRLGHAEREILRVLADAYPQSLSVQDVASQTQSSKGEAYEPEGGAFRNSMSRLRTLELVEGRGEVRISNILIERVPA